MTKTSARAPKTLLVLDAGSDLGPSICQALALEGHRLLLVGREDADLEALDASLAQSELHRFTPLDFSQLASTGQGEGLNAWLHAQELEVDGVLMLWPTGDAPKPDAVDHLLSAIWPRAEPRSAEPPGAQLSSAQSSSVEPGGERQRPTHPHDAPEPEPTPGRLALVVLCAAPHTALPDQPEQVRLWLAKLATDWAEHGVRLNLLWTEQVLTPGALEQAQQLATQHDIDCQAQLDAWAAAVPMGQLIPPKAVAMAVATLVGEFSSHLSGCVINLDGGSWAARQK